MDFMVKSVVKPGVETKEDNEIQSGLETKEDNEIHWRIEKMIRQQKYTHDYDVVTWSNGIWLMI